ncbi:unnamed protein product [Brugia pahangi]|uniref:BAH domain-containing protein n=1 Tax=Brugia pahangi TaxID=6280 RepID=A0A0N4TDU5_BRUPA|nr:unnamed protein product [Brugia pahangi]
MDYEGTNKTFTDASLPLLLLGEKHQPQYAAKSEREGEDCSRTYPRACSMIYHQGGHEVITGCGLHVLSFREVYLLLREIVERMSKGTNYSFEARWFSVSGDISDDESVSCRHHPTISLH